MLTLKQINNLAEEGWEIVFKRGRHPKRYSGWCLPEEQEIRLYLPDINGLDELSLTLTPELIHARGNVKRNAARDVDVSEESAETEAIETYKRYPEIAATIARVYSLDIEHFLKPLYRTFRKR